MQDMLRRLIAVLFVALAMPALADRPQMPPKEQLIEVVCVHVVDGDTAWFEEVDYATHKVRVLNIDTPETVHPDVPAQYYGQEASDYAQGRLLDNKAWLEYDVEPYDKYDRHLCHVWLEDGTLFGLEMVELGYAMVWVITPNVKYEDYFWDAQQRAMDADAGMWAMDEEEQ